MKSYEIFREIDPETAASVFQYLRDEEREVYTASLSSLATNRKLRPIFIQRKPASAQIEWLVKNVKLKTSDEIAEHVLQLWLMKAHQGMLTDFLDGVGIEHDGEGAAEDLPEDFDGKELEKTVDKLVEQHGAEPVRIYLHIFQTQRPGGWDELAAVINSKPELQFGEATEPDSGAPAAKESAKSTPAEAEEDETADDVENT